MKVVTLYRNLPLCIANNRIKPEAYDFRYRLWCTYEISKKNYYEVPTYSVIGNIEISRFCSNHVKIKHHDNIEKYEQAEFIDVKIIEVKIVMTSMFVEPYNQQSTDLDSDFYFSGETLVIGQILYKFQFPLLPGLWPPWR